VTNESIGHLGVVGRVALTVLAIYPVVMIVLATRQGPGISIDSVSYAASASSWAESGQLRSYDGRELSIFPVGLPVVIGSVMAAGLSLSSGVILTNVIATALTVLAAYFLGREVLRSPGLALLTAAFVALAASSVRVGSYFWTEPVFTMLLSWALVITARAVRMRAGSWWIPVAVGTLITATTMYRYVGIVALPVLALGVAYAATSKRITKGVSVLLIGSIGIAFSAGRNLLYGAPALGERYPGSIESQGALLGLVKLWGEYVAPSITTSLTVVAGSIVLVLIAVGVWTVLIDRNGPGILIASYVVIYWVAILVSQVGTRLDVATERFGAPALAPSVVLVLLAARGLIRSMSRQVGSALGRDSSGVHRVLASLSIVVLVGVVGLSILHAIRFVSEGTSGGLGLDSVAAGDRALSRAARDIPMGTVIASNDPWQVWWERGSGVVLDYPPSRSEWPAERVEADIDRLVSAVKSEGSLIVLLDEGSRVSLPVGELQDLGLVTRERGVQSGVAAWELRSAN